MPITKNIKIEGIDWDARLTAAHYNYEKGLNSHAFFKVSSHAVGEDLVQETFMKTWKYLIKGGEGGCDEVVSVSRS